MGPGREAGTEKPIPFAEIQEILPAPPHTLPKSQAKVNSESRVRYLHPQGLAIYHWGLGAEGQGMPPVTHLKPRSTTAEGGIKQ